MLVVSKGERVRVPREATYGKSPAIVEARLRPTSAVTGVSDAQYRAALATITRTGRVPAGWELQGVRWGHFTVRGEETDSFRFKRWQEGQPIDLQGFPAGLFRNAVVGIERIEGESRVVEVEREVVEIERVRGPRSRWHSKKTGAFVKDAYAKRYPHLVELDHVTERRVRRMRRTRKLVPVEEAVIRFTYESNFSVTDTPELGE